MHDIPFNSRRSTVYGTRGMVATSQPLAVAAGLEILAKGGNAADAAVATTAALNVTEPTSTGIGGDCFALYFDAATKTITALNGSGRAPAALTLERVHQEGFTSELPPFHPYTVTVPGACAGWCDLIDGHGKMKMGDILAPAIRLAEDGYPVAPITAHFWARGAERQLVQTAHGAELTISGRAPHAGEIFRNPGLVRTFRLVAEQGKDGFYQGPVAEAICKALADCGGAITEDDLARHISTWEEPISANYRGYDVWECPPNGQGLAALLALNILEAYDMADYPMLSAKRLHLQIESLRLAFADTRWYVADPAVNPIPLAELLSKEYARERRKLLREDRATLNQQYGTPFASSDTVYLTVVDGEGNACSFINSNYMGFGTGIVPEGWGFTLQNRGHGFSLDPDHPNALAPGKRPYHTIIPAMITGQHGELFASYGVMGGFMQPQGHLQVAMNLLDDGLDPQAALDQPRFCITDGSAGGRVALEAGIDFGTLASLAALDHNILPLDGHQRALFGRGQVILRDHKTGVLAGGSDPRADGCAMTR